MDENMTVAEVAVELRVTERTVRRWIENGYLPMRKIGGRVLVAREEFQKLAAKS